MHEMAIAEGILDIAKEHAAREKSDRITKIGLLIGEMAGVEEDALRLCFSSLVQGTLAEKAEQDEAERRNKEEEARKRREQREEEERKRREQLEEATAKRTLRMQEAEAEQKRREQETGSQEPKTVLTQDDESNYEIACEKMKAAETAVDYKKAAYLFEYIYDYKDSAELSKACRRKAEELEAQGK